ncbi:MAG: DUF3168 domain-containing protein [Pseudomonadota bacterium]
MPNAASDLQQGLYQTLTGDTELSGLLGANSVFDHFPNRAAHPYIVISRATSTDWSTSTEDGLEHQITFHIWSKDRSRAEVNAIRSRVEVLLSDAQISLNDNHLVNLTLEFAEARHDSESGYLHGIMRFRAVTEPVPA